MLVIKVCLLSSPRENALGQGRYKQSEWKSHRDSRWRKINLLAEETSS